MNTFTAGSSIKFGWETFKKRAWFFIGVTVLVCIADSIVQMPYQITVGAHATAGIQFAAYILSLLLGLVITIGLCHFTLKAHDDVATVSWEDLWHPQHYVSFVVADIIATLILIVGFILFIIPGIILMQVFAFPLYPIIEQGLGPIEALRYSARITKGHRWELFILGILSMLIVILGIICLGVGVLVALPIVGLANVHAYRTLQKIAGETSENA